jgi:beta-glucosidase
MGRNGTAKVSVTVTNTGLRAGDEVVQMYVHHPISSIVQPVIALRGFQRIHLGPHESKAVSFDVGPEQLSILDAEMNRTVETGPVEILIGLSSVDTSKVQLIVTE